MAHSMHKISTEHYLHSHFNNLHINAHSPGPASGAAQIRTLLGLLATCVISSRRVALSRKSTGVIKAMTPTDLTEGPKVWLSHAYARFVIDMYTQFVMKRWSVCSGLCLAGLLLSIWIFSTQASHTELPSARASDTPFVLSASAA